MVHDGVVSLVSCPRVWPRGMCVRGGGLRSKGGKGGSRIGGRGKARREGVR